MRAVIAVLIFLGGGNCLASGITPWQAPGFTLPDLQGKPHRLSDYQGQFVLLNFWATWCAPCREEMPSLESLKRHFRNQNLTVLTISVDKTRHRSRVSRFVSRLGLKLPVLLDTNHVVSDLYQVSGIPVTVIINPEGQVVKRIQGDNNWASEDSLRYIASLLN